jgi:hypothetical protein
MLINKRFIGNIIDVQLLYNLSTDQSQNDSSDIKC